MRSKFIQAGYYLLAGWILGLAALLEPLLVRNHHHYIIHGYAWGGYGYLNEDWLIQQATNSPLFALQVAFIVRFLDPALLYLYHIVLLAVYLFSLERIAFQIIGLSLTWKNRLTFAFFLTLCHSLVLVAITLELFGRPLTVALVSGVAAQGLISTVLEPATYGIFFLLALMLFMQRSYYAAGIAIAAASYYSSYLSIGGMLTLIIMILLWIETRSLRRMLLFGGLVFLLVLPQLIYVYINFRPTTPELFEEAYGIIMYERTPYHGLTQAWLTWLDGVRLLISIAALYLVRHSRLFYIFLVALLVVLITSAWQYWSPVMQFGSIYPWRFSVLLIPISTAVLIAWGMQKAVQVMPCRVRKTPNWVLAIVGFELLAMMIWFAGIPYGKSGMDLEPEDHQAIYQYVQDHKSSGDVYLIPMSFGAMRLLTGAPIFTNRYLPFRDVEILEWYKRVTLTERFYESYSCEDLRLITNQYRITHVLTEEALDCPEGNLIYEDEVVFIYKLDSR